MIHLRSDCLVFEMPDGDAIPCSAEAITFEIVGDGAALLDPEVLRHAAAAVLHYFREELERDYVSVAEFTLALSRALRGLGVNVAPDDGEPTAEVASGPGADLSVIAREAGGGLELIFFPRLREELRQQLARSPRRLLFRGLRGCVKQLAGARRWSRRCQSLQDQIVDYLRETLRVERHQDRCDLLVV